MKDTEFTKLEFVIDEKGDSSVGIWDHLNNITLSFEYEECMDEETLKEFQKEFKQLIQDFFTDQGKVFTKEEYDKMYEEREPHHLSADQGLE